MLPAAETIQIVLPIAAILGLLLTFKRSIYGVIAYFIILNAKLGDMYPALGAIRFELVAAVIVSLSIAVSGKGLGNILPGANRLNKPFWILFSVGMLSMVQAVDFSVSWENGGYNLLKLGVFYVMVLASIHDLGDLKRMLWAFVLVGGWTAYDPISNYLRGVVSTHGYGVVATGRFGAAAGHVALANTLNQSIPLTYFFALTTKNLSKRIVLWGLIGLMVLGVIVTKSRGGFIGLLVIVMGTVYLSKQRGKAVVLMVPLLMVALALVGQEYWAHMSTISHGIHGSRSSSDRYLGLVNGISMMIKRPLMGVGIGCYAEARRQYFNYYFYAHNLFGELFGELGLASAAWFFWVYCVLKKLKEMKQRLNIIEESQGFYYSVINGLQLGLCVRLVLGNLSHCAFIWFWFFMAAMTVSVDSLLSEKTVPASAER